MSSIEKAQDWVVKPAIAILAGSVLTSEVAHRQERRDFPVLPNEHILAHEVFECQDKTKASPPALVFLHGWPDDVALFRPFAKHLSAKYRCINCNLPGYPLPSDFRGNPGRLPRRNWGFGFDEAALALKNTILESCSNAQSVTLVTHDWGAIVGHLLHHEHPGSSLVQRIVALDVGWLLDGFPVLGALGFAAYQFLLNCLFLVPGTIGNPLTALEAIFLFRTAAPNAGAVTNDMNWPYRAAWRELLTNGAMAKLRDYAPSQIPYLFMHNDIMPGTLNFFDQKWEQQVKQTCPGISKVVSIHGGHWFPNSNTKRTLEVLEAFLEESEPHTKARVAKL